METALVVALISGAVALASATIAALAQLRVKNLETEARKAETRSEARVVLDRFRGPLLDAAWDLGDRIDNIVARDFLAGYLGTERESAAVTGTLFRMAQYFGWAEILRREIQLLRFESAGDTRRTAYFLSLVMRRFATDWYGSDAGRKQARDWAPPGRVLHELPSGHLMLWQEEQRGIGERMIDRKTDAHLVGYATFVEEYERRFGSLLGGFASQLRLPGVEDSLRLVEIRDALARLVEQLDEERRYVVGQVGYMTWLDSAHTSPCWDAYEHPVHRAERRGRDSNPRSA